MKRKLPDIALLVPFSLLTLRVAYELGYLGNFDDHRHSPAGWQVFADFVIACVLVLTCLIPETRQQNRKPWPDGVLTGLMGSIGPLLYMIFSPVAALPPKGEFS